MLRLRTGEEYEAGSEGGVRSLFALGIYHFEDTMDAEERYHHFIRERAPAGEPGQAYEVDRETMYEFMARYLAGLHEVEAYALDHSPSHHALLDVLEIATARARAGEAEFSWEEFDQVENEVLDEGDPEEEEP